MAGTTPWTTTFREYAGGPGVAPMIVFEQSFPQVELVFFPFLY